MFLFLKEAHFYPCSLPVSGSLRIAWEYPQTIASPYRSTQDATALIGNTSGHAGARSDFEQAKSEAETMKIASLHLPRGEHLGDPIDYAAYVVAQLTRDHILDPPGTIANFNLDADRGYAYLCWDWVRSHYVLAAPSAYRDRATPEEQREYHAPLQPGYGWCDTDILSDQTPQGSPRPVSHRQVSGFTSARTPTRIQYLDREDK